MRTQLAAMAGTFVCFILFVNHYMHVNDDSAVWVWFGMRSDGRCGRDFGTEYVAETTCGHGQCCSSHGWCGHGEEYCSIPLGCQNGCWPLKEGEHAPAAEAHHYVPDDDGYPYRHDDPEDRYAYDAHEGAGTHGRGYGHAEDEHYDDFHHRYDADPVEHEEEAEYQHGAHYHGGHRYDDHYDEHYDDHHDAHYDELGPHAEHDGVHGGGVGGHQEEEEGPELVSVGDSSAHGDGGGEAEASV